MCNKKIIYYLNISFFLSSIWGRQREKETREKEAKIETEAERERAFKYHLMPKCHRLKKFNRILMHSFPQRAIL